MIQIIGQNIPLINFTLTNCLRGATTTVKNNDQEKYVYIVAMEQHLMEKMSS